MSACLTKERLDNIWPNLNEEQFRHLEFCEGCQRLIRGSYPVLYLRPAVNIISRERQSNRIAEFLLEELDLGTPRGCIHPSDLDNILISDLRRRLRHIEGCMRCRMIIRYFSRCGGGFAYDFGNLSKLHELIEMNSEIDAIQKICCAKKDYKRHPLEDCSGNCFPQIEIGRDTVIFIPCIDKLNKKHFEECGHCQLVFHYWSHYPLTLFTADCYGYDQKTMRFFPVYSQDDQATIETHILGCRRCKKWAGERLRINFARDKAEFAMLQSKNRFSVKAGALMRNLLRPVGDFMSSCRFHFGTDGPFSMRHPWSVWNDKDRLTKLLAGDSLSPLEKLYRDAIVGKTDINIVAETFRLTE